MNYELKLDNIYFEFKKHLETDKTIIFIHGITGSSSAWNRYYNYFYKLGFNVLKFDLRGHGLSFKGKKTNYYKIENLAEDLNNLIIKNKINNPILISHSFGTFVVLEFLKKYPKIKISKIIFISPIYNLSLNNFSKKVIKFGTYIIPIFRKIGIQINYNKYFKNTSDYNLKRIIFESLNTNLKVICSLFNSVSSKEYFYIFKNIKFPVLLIHGKKDKISDYSTSIKISKEIQKSQLKIYDDLDHIIVLNNFNKIIDCLKKFILDNKQKVINKK